MNKKVKRNWKKWAKVATIRAVRTMAQVAGPMLVIGAFKDTPWDLMLQTTLTSGLASLLTSVVSSLPEE